MTEQQQPLQPVIEQQQQVIAEINNLTNQLTTKREIALKLQGVLEYLEQTGVTLPAPEENVQEEIQEEV